MATTTTDGGARIVATGFGPLALAGGASLAAGLIHAAAVGAHRDHPDAARAFVALAVLQVTWGALAMVGRHRLLALAGVALGAVAVGGWVLAKTSGIGLVDGLGESEAIQVADGLAAALAATATIVALRVAVAGHGSRRPARRPFLGVAAVVLLATSLVGMDRAGSHGHAGGHGEGGADGETAAADHGHEGATEADDGHHDTAAPSVATAPYDPTKPIDLGGVAGVTPEQQARAENLVAITLARLPRYADPKVAEADGYHSIGDAATGHEHLINWSLVDDGKALDPDVPEALVYEAGADGSRTLVSAMFMLPTGTTLDEVPELGGALTQWHIHDDLCLSDDPVAPYVAGITSVGGECAPPTRKLPPVPMIHVWITPHRCGPFASLEGIGAGQVAEGETRACDHAHGA